jgi:amino acid transporter
VDLRRAIGPWGGVAIMVGSTIGSGIFRTPASIARVLDQPGTILALWALFGLVSLCGALALTELASMLPRTGGTYVYIRAAYGDSAAFAYGWLYLIASVPSGIGALATVAGELSSSMVWGAHVPASAPRLLAIGAVVLVTVVNVRGVRLGAFVQGALTAVKVTALVAFIAVAFLVGHGDLASNLRAGAAAATSPRALASAAASVIFTYNGWAYISLVAGEIEAPERRLGRMIVTGMLLIIGLYLGANLAYLAVMPLDEVARQKIVAVAIMQRLIGPAAGAVMAGCVLASVLGALNGLVMAKSRVAYSLARDGLSFAALGRVHPRWATPHVAIVVQSAIALALVAWLRDFERLAAYLVVVEWSALVFAIAAVFVLRRRMKDAPRPYRTPGYPWTPLVFVVGTTVGLVAILWRSLGAGDLSPLVGLAISLAGFPVCALWRRRSRARLPAS